jgi:hypothetical protein
VLSVLLWYTDSDYLLYFWLLCCLSFFDILILITFCTFGYCVVCPSLIYWFWLPFVLLAIVLTVLLRYTDSDYLLYFWLLCCLSFLDILILITFCTFGYCVVCPSLIYGFWLSFVLLAIVLSVLLRYTDSDYLLYFWPLCCKFLLDILILITFCTFGYCVVCPS